MPDWLGNLIAALIGALGGSGGVLAILRMRSDARVAREVQQDDYTLKLINAQNASETEFRNAVINAYEYEVAARRELDARLTETQKQLTITTAERDLTQRQLERTQIELDAAHTKIRHLEDQIAALKQKDHV